MLSWRRTVEQLPARSSVSVGAVIRAAIDTRAERSTHTARPAGACWSGVADGSVDAVTSTEVVQAIMHRFARGRWEAGQRMATSVLHLFDELVPVDRRAIAGAVDLHAGHPQLSARDAPHAATCLDRGIGEIVSVDSGYSSRSSVGRGPTDDRGREPPRDRPERTTGLVRRGSAK